MLPPPPAARPHKGQSVCRVISLGWSWTLTPSPWCIPTTNPQTHSHNGHVWPHKRPVSLWSFLINLSLLFCHLLRSFQWWRSLVLRGRCTAWVVRLRKTTPSTTKSFWMINPTTIYQLIDAAMIVNCPLIIFNNCNWYICGKRTCPSTCEKPKLNTA